ncbi:MAG: hypothetical protein ACK5LV_07525 [Lachnospirales bacterium]
MEYNNEFLEELISYVELVYGNTEKLATDILSQKMIIKSDIDENINKTIQDYTNILKYLEFCNQNDSDMSFDVSTGVNIIKEVLQTSANENYVLLYDYLFYSLCGELSNVFSDLDTKLA